MSVDPRLIHLYSYYRDAELRGATLLHAAAEYGRVDSAMLLLERGLPGEAGEHFQQALRLNPGDARIRFNCAIAYARSDEASEAVAMAKDALALARSHGDVALGDEIEAWLTSFRAPPAGDVRARGRPSR